MRHVSPRGHESPDPATGIEPAVDIKMDCDISILVPETELRISPDQTDLQLVPLEAREQEHPPSPDAARGPWRPPGRVP